MTTNIATVILLLALGLTIEATIVNDETLTGSGTVNTMSDPSVGIPPPPHQ